MKTFLLTLVLLIVSAAVYLSLPLTSVAILTVSLLDQNNQQVTANAAATYFDADGHPIIKITPQTRGSWSNNLHWWTHNSHPTSNMRPADAMRAASVQIEAKDCEVARFAVKLDRNYSPLSQSPHGGGAAHFLYRFEHRAVLQCR